MPINASALIDALEARIEEAPDYSTDAVQKMSSTAQTAIKATLGSGAPLHLRTGRLLDSVEQTYFSPGAIAMAHVAPTVVYSRIQELGGISGKDYRSKLPPRPYVAPSIEESMELFEQDAIDAIRPMFW
jgi:phage gpG-like protein